MKSEYQGKQLSNPVSTGDGGGHFESRVQASFVILMLMKVRMSFLWNLPIVKVALQRRFEDIHTDDILLVLKEGDKEKKLFGQIKRTIHITQKDKIFKEVVAAAWQDYNGTLFRKNIDCIALITGPLSKSDIQGTRNLLEWARSSENADSFFRKVSSNSCSNEKRNKLSAFQNALQAANHKDVCKEIVFDFLQHFYLLSYDFDIKASIYESLICGMIQQYGITIPYEIWTRVIHEVGCFNQNAGEITLDTLPKDLLSYFQPAVQRKFPTELLDLPSSYEKKWPIVHDLNILYFALLGAYDERNSKDKELIEQVSGISYEEWTKSIRVMLEWPDSPLEVRNNIWSLSDRARIWKHVGTGCLLNDIRKFQDAAIEVLSEISSVFDIEAEKRYIVYGEKFSYSEILRNGIAEGILVLAKYTVSKQVDESQIRQIVFHIIKKILSSRSFNFWGSIDSQLPMLAEANPGAFLDNVEQAIKSKEEPFEKLFWQEKNAFGGQVYTLGLICSLEQLSWNRKLFTRVCCIFAQLANTSKRESIQNILVNIFLPWVTNTSATLEEKIITVQCMKEENFDVTWNVLLQMLPGKVMTSFEIRKPIYAPVAYSERVTKRSYIETIDKYVSELIKMVEENLNKLPELICDIWKFPENYFSVIIEFLHIHRGDIQIQQLQKDIWQALQKALRNYHKYSNAYENVTKQQVKEIKNCIELYCPTNIIEQHSLLFIKNEFSLYDAQAEIDVERKKIESRRVSAVSEIFGKNGLRGIFQLTTIVEDNEAVGRSLSKIGNHEIDLEILPSKLFDSNFNIVNMAIAYAKNRYYDGTEEWIDSLPTNKWDIAEKCSFLLALPFYHKIWPYVERWLGNQAEKYWVKSNAYSIGIDDYGYAIDNLIKYNRACTAIRFLYYIWKLHRTFDCDRICNALLRLTQHADSIEEKIDGYIVSKLIEHLQKMNNAPIIHIDKLEEIEWQYTQVIESYEVYPVTLYKEIAYNAVYFCQLVRAIFRSEKDKDNKGTSELKKNIARNAWHVLDRWNIVPGTQKNGIFSWDEFRMWYETVKNECRDSGHLYAANHYIGRVFIYAPQDASGLWICKELAQFLNGEDVEDIRHGFFEKIINSRGVYWGDPEGKEERELAAKYRNQATEIKQLGYRRFAAMLEKVSDFYETEAERCKNRFF